MNNTILNSKIKELKIANEYESWYIVKQHTQIAGLCYLVFILNEYKLTETNNNLKTFIENRIKQIKDENKTLELPGDYRALRCAAIFGLVKVAKHYEDYIISETFHEITQICNGHYENTELYQRIIDRQIEKIYMSIECIDEKAKTIRSDFKLFPLFFLYKILLEIGKATNEFKITKCEYINFVATTKTHNDFIKTLCQILSFRENQDLKNELSEVSKKFDNRFIKILEQNSTLEITNNEIKLKTECIQEISKKVMLFELNFLNQPILNEAEYINFLCSEEELIKDSNSDSTILEDESIINTLDTYTKDDFLSTAYISREKLETILKLAIRKKNIILDGPPGVGKTFLARLLAYVLLGKKDDSKIWTTQFHQGTESSDFIERTEMINNTSVTKIVGFAKFCEKIKDDKDNLYVCIIDEFNRGNPATIFGDVFTAIENNKRDKVINLTSSGTPFVVPSNLIIIGCLNPLDKSVSNIDHALMQRFSRISIEPGFDTPNFINDFNQWFGEKYYTKTIDFIKELNLDIADDNDLGPQFSIGHRPFCVNDNLGLDDLKLILRYDILGIIKDYWSKEEDKIEYWTEKIEDLIGELERL